MNDHQTNGNGVFSLQRKDDPDTKKILHGRWEVLTDWDLTDGAKVLFVLLLDLSLNPAVNMGRRGEITISTTQLCEKLSRSPRAIWGWTGELKQKRFVWVSKKKMPNMKPMNQYHITALQPIKEAALDVTSDGLWGNGKRRSDSMMPLGARGVTGTKRQVIVDRFGAPVSSESLILLENAAATRTECASVPQNLRVRPAQNDTCHPQNLRGAAARNDTCHPQVLRGASASSAGVTRTDRQLLGESQDVSVSPIPALAIVQRSTRNALKLRKGGETGFLDDVLETISAWDLKWAAEEMKNSGAWWRLKYRTNPELAERVLAEIGCLIKEGKIKSNPGAAAVDLWGRWQ